MYNNFSWEFTKHGDKVQLTVMDRNLNMAMEWGLFAVIFFLPISMPAVSAALLFCVSVWVVKAIYRRQYKWVSTPLDLPIGAFVGIAGLSIWGSPDRFVSFYNYGYLMVHYVLAFYLIVHHIQTFDQIKRLLMVLFFSATLTSFYGFYQYIHCVDISQYRWVDGEQFPGLRARIFSTMENPNIYAGYMVTVIALAGGMMLTAMQRKVKLCYIGLLCVFCTCLALTYSRGGWVSFLSVLATLALFRSKRLLWLVVAVPLIAILVNPMLIERFASIIHPVDSSSALRIALWESSWAMLVEHPLLGIGWGAYWMVYPNYDFFINNSATTIFHAHNMYLHIGAELGFLGLGAFIWLLVSVLRMALTLNRQCSQHEICGISLGLAAAIIGIIINGLTDHVMFNIQMSIFFWIIAGITVSISMFIQPGKRLGTGSSEVKGLSKV